MLSKIRGIARALLGATEEQRAQLERQYMKRLTRLGILPESANLDNILTVPRQRLKRLMGACDTAKIDELNQAIKAALDVP